MSTPGKSFDPSTVSRATWIAAGGSLVLFISVFLSWYKATGLGFSASVSGWDAVSTAKFVALLALIALAAIAIELFAANITLPLPASLIVIGVCGLATLLVLLKMVSHPGGGGVGLAWGIYVALIAGIVATVGGYLKMQEG